MKLQTPLRYPGGKKRLQAAIRHLLLLTPCHTYVEPFCGGGAIGLWLLGQGVVNHVLLNDFDPAVVSFWHYALYENRRFLERLGTIEISLSQWYHQKAIYETVHDLCFDLGFSAFFLNRTNFSGILSAGPIGGLRQESPYKIHCRFNRQKLLRQIALLGDYADYITVSFEDGRAFLEKTLPTPSFFYIDPPYVQKGPLLYKNDLTETYHRQLADLLGNHREQPWVVSYDDDPLIRSL